AEQADDITSLILRVI
ncbi:MAG: hypothetical protein KDC45_00750, partial [Bacteroidetes bacterium]|nr:hypothetical protein [Bacteroidota bacterium]